MAKQCNQCGKTKPLTEFHKKTKSKDGKQDKCKSCVKVVNQNFREEKPQYQNQWVKANKRHYVQYQLDYKRADKSSLIYKISSPDDMVYIGSTKTHLFVRFIYHKRDYRCNYGRIPELHKSFDKWGYDAHRFELLIDLGDLPRKELNEIESKIIEAYKQKGMSLNIKS
jgi:hypothetical protein